MKSARTIFAALIILLLVSAFRIPESTRQTTPEKQSRETGMPVFHFAEICDNSMYIQDVTIKDSTRIKPNTPFIKKWEVKNTGTCGWNKRYSLQLAKGDSLSGEAISLSKWVAPGKTVVLSVNMLAPATEGAYTGYWILTNSNEATFGTYLTVKIIVKKKTP
jgi:hypothetical protein